MKKIAIIDYSVGNILSLEHALRFIGYKPVVTNDLSLLKKSSHLILPGVGAFGFAMQKLKSKKLDKFLKDRVKNNFPILGICLGLQLFFESSQEFGRPNGLGILKGHVKKINPKNNKVPVTGWIETNYIKQKKKNFLYYTHSYHCIPKNKKIITNYYILEKKKIITGIKSKNITGFQFHPEKSSDIGLGLLKDFILQ